MEARRWAAVVEEEQMRLSIVEKQLVEREQRIHDLEAALGRGGGGDAVLLSAGRQRGDTGASKERDLRFVTMRDGSETEEQMREKAAAAYFPNS
jgi:hypothetical protein